MRNNVQDLQISKMYKIYIVHEEDCCLANQCQKQFMGSLLNAYSNNQNLIFFKNMRK